MGFGPPLAALYVTEVSPSFVRDTYGSFIQIATCLGFMGALFIGILVRQIAGWNLANNQFNGGVPYSISQMTSLEYLDIFNTTTRNLLESFSSLSSMTSMCLQNHQFTGTIDVLSALPLENLNVANNHFIGWIPQPLANINSQKEGNNWNSRSAPPSPPGTPPAPKHPSHKSGGNNSPSDGGNKKSGKTGGGIAGIIISILVVGAIVAFFLWKRRSRRSSSDIEKLDNEPFAPLIFW